MAKSKSDKALKSRKPPGKPTPTELKNAHAEQLRRISEQYKTGRYFIVGAMITGSVCYGCYCLTQAAASLAGKQTDVNAVFSALADMRLSTAGGYALAAIFGGTTVHQWRGRKKAERAASRAAELEKLIDPGRRGSGLDYDGANPEEDAL